MAHVMDYPIVAYTERDSIDPMTCEEGKLRREWTVLETSHALSSGLLEAPERYGVWRDVYSLFARYNRRGTIEPWQLMGFYPTEETALRDILDTGVVPVDLRLVTIFREREWVRRVEEAKRAAASEKNLKREAERRRRSLGSIPFAKMMKSGKPADVELCERWNAFTSNPENVKRRGELKEDEEFMSLYNEGLFADRVPSKRKALREFLEYVERKYGWTGSNGGGGGAGGSETLAKKGA